MRKAIAIMLTAMAIAGCAEQENFDIASVSDAETTVRTEGFNDYMAKARRGDGEAYLKLAECYTRGDGVKADFLGTMTMLSLAKDYGGINDIKDYIGKLPEDNSTRMICEAMDKIDTGEGEKAMEIADELIARGRPDGYAVKSFVFMERNDTVNAVKMASIAAGQGSTTGKVILQMISSSLYDIMEDEEQVNALGEDFPVIYRILAEECADMSYYNPEYKVKAAGYFLKADKAGILKPENALWLTRYIEKGGDLQLPDEEVQRLKQLCKDIPRTPDTETPDTDRVLWEEELPDSVSAEEIEAVAREWEEMNAGTNDSIE